MTEIPTTKAQRDILRHALFGGSPARKPYRNYYGVCEGDSDEPDVLRLIDLGLMLLGPDIDDGHDFYAHVTEAGAAEIDVVLPVELKREMSR